MPEMTWQPPKSFIATISADEWNKMTPLEKEGKIFEALTIKGILNIEWEVVN